MVQPPQANLSIYTSLKLLPKWYQVFGISGILVLVYLRHDPIVAWLVTKLHQSFGTQYIWLDSYQTHLENMSFNERIAFTFYGVALAASAGLLIRCFIWSRPTFGHGEYFPDRSTQNVVCLTMLCLFEMVVLKDIIHKCLEDPNSQAHAALQRMNGEGPFQAERARNSTSFLEREGLHWDRHYVIQKDILFNLIKVVAKKHTMVLSISALYRIVHDVPRKIYMSLRWYMLTYITAYSVIGFLTAVIYKNWCSLPLWVSIASTLVYYGMLNYTYGSSKRAGMTKDTSYAHSARMVWMGLLMCSCYAIVALLSMLTIIVSVHVFELIFVWVSIFFTVMWVPAATDSFAMSYMVLITGATALIGNSMGALTYLGAVRYVFLVTLSWIDICLMHNVVLIVSFSRYVAIVVDAIALVGISLVTILHAPYLNLTMNQLRLDAAAAKQPLAEHYLLRLLRWMSNLCNLDASFSMPADPVIRFLHPILDTNSNALSTYITYSIFHVLVGVVLLTLIYLIDCSSRSAARSKKLNRYSISVITPTFFICGAVRGVSTTVVMLLFGTTYILVDELLLPRFPSMKAVPSVFRKLPSVLITSIILGFIDCGEVIYDSLLRALALKDPPVPLVEGDSSNLSTSFPSRGASGNS